VSENQTEGGPLNRLALLREQWVSMAGMATMFVITILLGIWIQPYHNNESSRAFGTEGASQVRWIGFELLLIFAFTALIIWLAKKGHKWIIRWGIFGILFFALLTSVAPITFLLISDSTDPPSFDEPVKGDLYLDDLIDGSGMLLWNGSTLEAVRNPTKTSIGVEKETIWSYNLSNLTPEAPPLLAQGDGYIGVCTEDAWAILDAKNGTLRSEGHADRDDRDLSRFSCDYALELEGQVVLIDHRRISLLDPKYEHGDTVCSLPSSVATRAPWVSAVLLNNGDLMIADSGSVALVDLPPADQWSARCGVGPQGASRGVPFETNWQLNMSESISLTAIEFGRSPTTEMSSHVDDDGTNILVLGDSTGSVTGFEVFSNFSLGEKPLLNVKNEFDAPILGLKLADWNQGGWNDLFVTDSTHLRMLSGTSFTEHLTLKHDFGASHQSQLSLRHDVNELWSEEGLYDSDVFLVFNGNWTSASLHLPTEKPVFLLWDAGVYLVDIIALGICVSLMVALIFYPEWWVVNTVGILVGSGVVTILGVSFVPWLVILFMILAAVYDFWAVHRSKHMLELADTMIDLKLPILLVSPQEKGYSFRDAKSPSDLRERAGTEPTTDQAESTSSSNRDALFMGLGDVIFPGMLVISSLTWISSDPTAGLSAGMWVAIGTLIGGLIGYSFLMVSVAMGRPQPGLPLLNGGSIIGHLIFAIIVIGPMALIPSGVGF